MKLIVFAVLDSKAGFFGQPFFDQTEATAIRSFADAVNHETKENQWFKHPEDFTLYRLGEYENSVGSLVSNTPVALVTASALRAVDKAGGGLDLFQNNVKEAVH